MLSLRLQGLFDRFLRSSSHAPSLSAPELQLQGQRDTPTLIIIGLARKLICILKNRLAGLTISPKEEEKKQRERSWSLSAAAE